MRLGEVLIRDGVLSDSQLKTALDAQLVYGGHLGTNLVELGFVDIETLGATLAAEFRIEQVQQQRIEDVPGEVLALIPTKLVERHQVIPFELETRTLHVAMVDPRNLLALDELSFVCGCRIEAWVAPELLIVSAMERYYGIGRKLRYIQVSGRPRNRPRVTEPVEPTTSPAPTASVARPDGNPEASAQSSSPRPAPPGTDADARTRRPTFVSQPSPAYRGRDSVDASGKATLETVSVEWIKTRTDEDEPGRWSEIFGLDLDDEHFDGLEGVFVVWHRGRNPVLRVGHGRIRAEIEALRRQPDVIAVSRESEVFVTWARVERSLCLGIERYLETVLNPQVPIGVLDAEPIPVDLPR